MPSKIMKPTDFDVTSVKYSPVKTYTSGAKAVYMNINEGPIHLQVPELDIPFDSGTYYPSGDDDGFGKFAIKTSLKGYDSDAKIKEFHDKLLELDQKICDDAMKNSQSWFKKK